MLVSFTPTFELRFSGKTFAEVLAKSKADPKSFPPSALKALQIGEKCPQVISRVMALVKDSFDQDDTITKAMMKRRLSNEKKRAVDEDVDTLTECVTGLEGAFRKMGASKTQCMRLMLEENAPIWFKPDGTLLPRVSEMLGPYIAVDNDVGLEVLLIERRTNAVPPFPFIFSRLDGSPALAATGGAAAAAPGVASMPAVSMTNGVSTSAPAGNPLVARARGVPSDILVGALRQNEDPLFQLGVGDIVEDASSDKRLVAGVAADSSETGVARRQLELDSSDEERSSKRQKTSELQAGLALDVTQNNQLATAVEPKARAKPLQRIYWKHGNMMINVPPGIISNTASEGDSDEGNGPSGSGNEHQGSLVTPNPRRGQLKDDRSS